jgi:hypothetical protein
MPFAGFDSFDSCVRTMTDEEGHDQDSAENICGALQAEAKAENGNVDELMDALERGAGLIADVGVELNSAVDVPAIDSKWVMFKSAGESDEYDHRVEAPHLLQKDAESEKRISYAPAMIPREPDKEGDVVPTATVERAAHGYLKEDGGVDADHDLIDGKGEPVESWIEPTEREWDLPGGGTETYPPGTWMLGIEWDAKTWDRIQSGELEGLSIYGRAEHVDLAKAAGDETANVTKQPEPEYDAGDWVRWDFAGGTSDGQVTDSRNEPGESLSVDGNEREVSEDDPEPVYKVDVWREDDGELRGQAVKSESELRSVDPPEEFEASADGATTKTGDGEVTEQEPPMTDPDDGGGDGDDGSTLESVAASVDSLADTVNDLEAKIDGDPDGGGADETAKAEDYWDVIEPAAEDIAALPDMDMSTGELEELLGGALEDAMSDGDSGDGEEMAESAEKELTEETAVTMLAESDAIDAGADRIAEALEPLFNQSGGDKPDEIENESDDEEDDEDDAEMSAEKSFDPEADDGDAGAKFAKGFGTGGDAASVAKDSEGTDDGLPSYQGIAEANGGN